MMESMGGDGYLLFDHHSSCAVHSDDDAEDPDMSEDEERKQRLSTLGNMMEGSTCIRQHTSHHLDHPRSAFLCVERVHTP